MSVCPLACFQYDTSKLHEIFLYMLPVAVARSSSDDRAIRHVLPVLWMTSRFQIVGHMARGVDSKDVDTVLKQVVKNLQHIGAPRCLTLSSYTTAANGAPGAKCDAYDCVVRAAAAAVSEYAECESVPSADYTASVTSYEYRQNIVARNVPSTTHVISPLYPMVTIVSLSPALLSEILFSPQFVCLSVCQ